MAKNDPHLAVRPHPACSAPRPQELGGSRRPGLPGALHVALLDAGLKAGTCAAGGPLPGLPGSRSVPLRVSRTIQPERGYSQRDCCARAKVEPHPQGPVRGEAGMGIDLETPNEPPRRAVSKDEVNAPG